MKSAWFTSILTAALAGSVCFACSGASSATNYGVAPWSGPATDFAGTWVATGITDQSGSSLPQGSAVLRIAPYVQPVLKIVVVLSIVSENSQCNVSAIYGTEMTVTADGHGFDGAAGDFAIPIHVRMDAEGTMHAEVESQGERTQSPTGALSPVCGKAQFFAASRNPDGGA